MVKVCKRCSRIFTALTDKALYCSRCRKHVRYYKPTPVREAACEECGRVFTTNRKDRCYCSDACRLRHNGLTQPEPYVKICPTCERVYRTGKSYQVYCGIPCYKEAKSKRDKKRYRKEE